MIDQWQPVAEPFQALQEPDQPGVIQLVQRLVFDQLQQLIKADIQGIQRVLDYAAVPEVDTSIYSNRCSIASIIPSQHAILERSV